MLFPFPPNPVNGQVATQAQPDGTVLKASYIQSKNEWVVERVRPKDPTLTLTAGTAYTVVPGQDGQVLTYDQATNQWIGKTPVMSTGDLSNVNANTIDGGGRTHGAVFQWDDHIGEWVSSDTLEVSEVQTDTLRLGGAVGGEIYYFEETDFTLVDPADDGNTAASVYAIKEYIKAQPKPFLEELDDCQELGRATDGQIPRWDNANSKWVPMTAPTFQSISKADYAALGTKKAGVLYLVHN